MLHFKLPTLQHNQVHSTSLSVVRLTDLGEESSELDKAGDRNI